MLGVFFLVNVKAMKGKKSIAQDLIIWSIFLQLIISGGMALILYLTVLKPLEQHLIDETTNMTKTFAKFWDIHIWNLDIEAMRNHFKKRTIPTEMNSINVYNEFGNKIFKKEFSNASNLITKKENIYYRDHYIGYIEVTFSKTRINEIKRNILFTVSFVPLIAIFLFAVLIRFLIKVILSKPLINLTHRIRNVAKGDYKTQVPQEQYRDIDFIVDEVNLMISKISERTLSLTDEIKERKETEKKLNQAIVDVEKANYAKIQLEEKQKVQKQLFQSSKLFSLGVLASGVAHELNNPLTGIIGFAQLIQEEAESEEVTAKTNNIINASKRMKNIIDHLRRFSRQSSRSDWAPLDINEPIRNSFILLETQLKNKNIQYELELHDNLPLIHGDSNLIESIFQNLIINSKDAFKENPSIENKKIHFKSLALNNSIKIFYTDNAGGMTEEVSNHIFDPFFTTKDVNKGTGLGMSVTHGIIKEHNAEITLTTRKGEGAIFEITFPLYQNVTKTIINTKPKITLGKVEKKKTSLPSILVVDDEVMILEIIDYFLEKDFSVTLIQDSTKAIKLIEKFKFDIILTDIKMPKKSGIDVIQAAQFFQKNTPVIAMSGHAKEEEDVKNVLRHGARDAISKPFEHKNEILKLLKKYM